MNDGDGAVTVRIDRWLWFARFIKSRTAATRLVAAGKVRVNRTRIDKAHYAVRVGDVLTFPQGDDVRVVKIAALGERRGPAKEARMLYEDLSPPEPRSAAERQPPPPGRRPAGAGRPTKAERRAIDHFRGRDD